MRSGLQLQLHRARQLLAPTPGKPGAATPAASLAHLCERALEPRLTAAQRRDRLLELSRRVELSSADTRAAARALAKGGEVIAKPLVEAMAAKAGARLCVEVLCAWRAEGTPSRALESGLARAFAVAADRFVTAAAPAAHWQESLAQLERGFGRGVSAPARTAAAAAHRRAHATDFARGEAEATVYARHLDGAAAAYVAGEEAVGPRVLLEARFFLESLPLFAQTQAGLAALGECLADSARPGGSFVAEAWVALAQREPKAAFAWTGALARACAMRALEQLSRADAPGAAATLRAFAALSARAGLTGDKRARGVRALGELLEGPRPLEGQVRYENWQRFLERICTELRGGGAEAAELAGLALDLAHRAESARLVCPSLGPPSPAREGDLFTPASALDRRPRLSGLGLAIGDVGGALSAGVLHSAGHLEWAVVSFALLQWLAGQTGLAALTRLTRERHQDGRDARRYLQNLGFDEDQATVLAQLGPNGRNIGSVLPLLAKPLGAEDPEGLLNHLRQLKPEQLEWLRQVAAQLEPGPDLRVPEAAVTAAALRLRSLSL